MTVTGEEIGLVGFYVGWVCFGDRFELLRYEHSEEIMRIDGLVGILNGPGKLLQHLIRHWAKRERHS